MDFESAKLRVEQLVEQLNIHNYNYYVLDKPVISDYDFDVLLKELSDLESQYPQLLVAHSPTQRVGGDIIKSFVQVKHKSPMLSLANTYSEEELKDFDNRIRKLFARAARAETCKRHKRVSRLYDQA